MARFTLPRDLYHGKGALEALKTFEGKKAIICVGGGSMKRFGFLDKAKQYLEEAGMEVQLYEGIEPDPSVETVMKGEAVDMVGGPQIRNIGTIGGNTCNGVTSADSASTLHAWDAIVEITGPEGVRRLPIHDFYIKAGKVDLRPGELQTAIIIPKKAYEGYFGHYIKYAMRNAMDIATTGCSVNVKLSEDKKTILDARIAYGVAGPVPMRAPSAEAKIRGKETGRAAVKEFAQAVLEDINPRDSWRAAKDFREHIATVLAERALCESIRLAGGEVHE